MGEVLSTVWDGLQNVPDGVRGVVGARPRVRDLGDRPGMGPARARRARARGDGVRAGRQGDGARRRVLVVLRRRRSRSPRCSPRARPPSPRSRSSSRPRTWSGSWDWSSVLIGWQFTLAEFVGGFVLIALMALMLRLFVSPRLEQRAREHARRAGGSTSTMASSAGMSVRERVTSAARRGRMWPNFRADWKMLWKEITAGSCSPGSSDARQRRVRLPLRRGRARRGEDDRERDRGPDHRGAELRARFRNAPLAAVLWSGGSPSPA